MWLICRLGVYTCKLDLLEVYDTRITACLRTISTACFVSSADNNALVHGAWHLLATYNTKHRQTDYMLVTTLQVAKQETAVHEEAS